MKEPWIRVHAHLVNRPVVSRLAHALRVDPFKAIGHLVTFWGAASQHSANGSIANVPDSLLEQWAGWRGKRGAFAAWVRAEHMDADGRVNEWDDYQGTLEQRREKERQRIADKRAVLRNNLPTVAQQPADCTQGVATHARERNGTERDGTERNQTTLPPDTPRGDALPLVIAANQAIDRRWGEQTRPMTPGHGPSHQLAVDLHAAGVPVEFAQRSIARQVEAKADGPPRSMAYFRAGVLADWEGHQVRALGAGAPDVIPLEPAARPRRAHGDTGFLASVIAEEEAKRKAQEVTA